jgi:hypothetical protein
VRHARTSGTWSTSPDAAGGALRLAHRALETHGRDLGYDIDACIDDALLLVGAELAHEHDEPVLIDQVRQATAALTHAIAATAEDRMLVPEALSQSIRHLFVFYLVARPRERQCDPAPPRPSDELQHAVSREDRPDWQLPTHNSSASTGTFAPGRISSRSPTATSAVGTSTGSPVRSTTAFGGARSISARIASEALPRARISNQWPSSTNVASIAPASSNTSPVRPAVTASGTPS